MPPTQITDTAVLTVPQGNGAYSSVTIRTSADPEREYVAAGGTEYLSTFGITLPAYIDDITRDLDREIYSTMQSDPHLAAGLRVLVDAILAHKYSLTSAVPREGDEGFAIAKEVRDFVQQNFDNLDTPLNEVLRELLAAMVFGHKVAEVVYDTADWGDGPRWVWTRIKAKPLGSTAFVVDRTKEIIGLLNLAPGGPVPVIGGNLTANTTNLDYLQQYLLPRDKFIIHTHEGRNGDPRGVSIYRPAYHAWWMKAQVWKAYLQFLATFAQPSIVGFTDPLAELPEEPDPASPGANLPQRTKEEVMLDALVKIQNGACGAFPGGSRVQIIESHSAGEPFLQAFGICNHEMTLAIHGQVLMTQEGTHMSRAAATTHQDVFGLLVRAEKVALVTRFRQDAIRVLVRLNYGDEVARRYTPVFGLGETEHQDFAAYAGAIAALTREGFYDESQYEALDDFMGGPARDPNSWAKRLKQEQAIAEATAQAAQVGATAAAQPGSAAGPPGVPAVAKDAAALIPRTIAKQAAVRAASRVGSEGA